MPELLNDEAIELLLNELKNATPVTLNVNDEKRKLAEKECDEYIKNGNINVHDMNPLSVYFIISKLKEEDQINFIKENINYIKEHDEDIFLYKLYAPQSLSYFLSVKVLKEIKTLDLNIFKKIINQNQDYLLHGFNQSDYIEFYNDCFEEISEIDNIEFINSLYSHNRFCYDNINMNDLEKTLELQKIYNKEFIIFILEKYKNKISNFTHKELLNFTKYIENNELYKNFINENYEKLNNAFYEISEYELDDYLSETGYEKQEILIYTFFDNIIKKQDITKIIYKISPSIIIDLYNKDKTIFNPITLKDWIKVCSKSKILNDEFKKILDTFEINDIESLFDSNFFRGYYGYTEDTKSLKYIEMKYRNSIKTNGILDPIDETTSIFSEKYLKNIKELKNMLKNNTISKNDKLYKQHLSNFILYLKQKNIITNIEGNNFKEIEKLFFRIVMGTSITILYKVSSIEEITILNRLGKIEFNVTDFTIEQLENYNVKHHKQLYQQFEKDEIYIRKYKKLLLKLIFIIGFNHAKKILELDNELPTLEHLVGNVDIKNIIIDNQGNPILNNKIMNLLFNDKDYSKIKEMLSNKDSDLYKYFPRIFSEWEIIQMNNKEKSLKTIIDFLKSDNILLPSKYYRLEGLFKFIGCNNSIVNETLSLHDEILKRNYSTIPRIKGTKDEYSYEILKLDDMEGLCVGNKTNCCFTVLGNGYSCLKHAVTNKDGRILVIKKNEELLAHSWLWRSGDLLCLDNIEISKSINKIDFLDVYLKLSDEIIQKSFEEEGINNCIKNITIGFTNFDKRIEGIEKYPCLISKSCNMEEKDFGERLGKEKIFMDTLPQPKDYLKYSDSKNVQYLIKGNGIFKLNQVYHNYQDEREEVMHYISSNNYDKEFIDKMNKKINALRYIKAEQENSINKFKVIDTIDYSEVYCNNDWYIIYHQNGLVETFTNSYDQRSKEEIKAISKDKAKVIIRKK